MDDLAHSLKTPLSVLGNISTQSAQSGEVSADDNRVLNRQTERMKDIISYHLQRARAGNRQALAPPLSPEQTIRRLGESLQKIYADTGDGKPVQFITDIEPEFALHIAESDLLEMLGNVMENACKYGAKTVTVSAHQDAAGLRLSVSDDGPGFPAGATDELSVRGRRADTKQEGQGLGLALTAELVESYGGSLQLRNSQFGGAEIVMLFAR